MIVSEFQARLHAEGFRLLDRLGLKDTLEDPTKSLPSGYGFLHLIPALQAIVDRLEERDGLNALWEVHKKVLEDVVDRLEKLEGAARGQMIVDDPHAPDMVVSHDRAVEVPTEVWNSLCGDVVALRERVEKLEARWAIALGEQHKQAGQSLTLVELERLARTGSAEPQVGFNSRNEEGVTDQGGQVTNVATPPMAQSD